jgi:hypothetical protein
MGTIADHKAVDEDAERQPLRDGRHVGTSRECLVPEGAYTHVRLETD